LNSAINTPRVEVPIKTFNSQRGGGKVSQKMLYASVQGP
jgi:hypothetical protein